MWRTWFKPFGAKVVAYQFVYDYAIRFAKVTTNGDYIVHNGLGEYKILEQKFKDIMWREL